jgi:TRAP-type mannitol/chloroaromatic compound transport system permease small subunit
MSPSPSSFFGQPQRNRVFAMEGLFTKVDRTTTFIGRAVAQFYFLLASITLYEVVMRYFFHAPTMWAFEMVMLLCAMAWMLSVGFVTQQQGHIAITIFYVISPKRVQWWLDVFANVVGVLVLGTLTYASWPLMRDALVMYELSGTAFNSPEPMITKTVLFLGALMYVVQLVVNTVRHLQTYGSWR